jgi:predicted nucleic acid-binding protein
MRPRPPSDRLVVDANVILSALLGRVTHRHLRKVNEARDLCTTRHAFDEALTVLDRIGATSDQRKAAGTLFKWLPVAPTADYETLMEEAAASLSRAPASRTGSTADAHILALAWTLDADIWSHDRDFAGTGWPSWSSANLIDELAGEAA